MKCIQHVRITGATGDCAGLVNGVYKPTEELRDNATVYVRADDDDVLLECRATTKQWQVKPAAGIGGGTVYAYCVVPAKGVPESCPASQWQIYDDGKFGPQRAVTITVEMDNSDALLGEGAGVGLGDVGDQADNKAKPNAAAMKDGAGLAAAPTACVGKWSAAAATPCSVRMEGAMGPNVYLVNGVYEPTSELSEDVPVFAKVGEPNVYLEYNADINSWTVQSTDYNGIAEVYAVCSVPAKCLPQHCPISQWRK